METSSQELPDSASSENMDPWRELELEETGWHDGNVHRVDVQISEQGMVVTLELEIYQDLQHARDRHRLTIRFINVREFAMVGTASELLHNLSAGHISSARLGGVWRDPSSTSTKHPRLDLNVYLCGGYIRVSADTYEVSPSR